jgi:hypothetical protein
MCPMATKSPVTSSRDRSPVCTFCRTSAPLDLAVVPTRSRTTLFQRNSIFGLALARSCMIFEARSSSRRWMRVTVSANFVRKVASSMAESPPPTTAMLLATEEEAVAGGAGRHPVAEQPALASGPSISDRAPVDTMIEWAR